MKVELKDGTVLETNQVVAVVPVITKSGNACKVRYLDSREVNVKGMSSEQVMLIITQAKAEEKQSEGDR